MLTFIDKLLLMLASRRSASIAIYFGMVQYASLWVFPASQSTLLTIGLFFYALRVPYFVKIGERAFVAQSIFFFCVEFLALFLSVQAQGLSFRECYAIF